MNTITTTIENECLTVEIAHRGAELLSLRRKSDDLEYLWQGDAAVWPDRAPLLFPVVARQREDSYLLDDKRYAMPMHGFAKDKTFTVECQAADSVTLILTDDEETQRWYPFPFALRSIFRLEGRNLRITRQIQNMGDTPMPCSIGEHPGYNLPLFPDEALEDYSILFERRETASRWLLEDEIICGQESFLKNQDVLPLTKSLFERGALIFKGLQSKTVRLAGGHHGASVTVNLGDAAYLGIWSKPGAPFVCIEPWRGLASSKWSSQKIWEKEGIQRVEAGGGLSLSTVISLT